MRNFINIITENKIYADRLNDSEEIAQYITDLDPKADYEFVESFFDDEYRGCGATLKMIPVEKITEGHPDGNVRSPGKEKRFAKLTTAIPPIVIGDDFHVLDGNHRLRVAIQKGMEEIPCYVMD